MSMVYIWKGKSKRIGSIEPQTETYWSTTFSTCANLTCCLATGIDRAIRSGAARSNDIVVSMYVVVEGVQRY
jgi:hypothetical protein